jgi:AcrR family transcriptional regulator
MTESDRAEGLRERKKRRTRQNISDIATGLFLKHGFDAVTITQIAETADVSVNTVYNYFPAKEDLFFDREDEAVDRLSRIVRERGVGESATRAILATLRTDIEQHSPQVGLMPGFARFMRVVHASPVLSARLWRMQQAGAEALATVLAEESGAEPDDPMPEMVAGQLAGIQQAVIRCISSGIGAGEDPATVAAAALRRVAAAEKLLSPQALDFATRELEGTP